jgi:cytochrome P450
MTICIDERALTGVDLADPDLYATGDPHAVWRALRRVAPVYWNPEADGPGFWVVTAYEHALAVYRDTHAFSSAHGSVLRSDRRAPDPGAGRMLVQTDPPRHRKVRSLLTGAFTPGTIARLRRTAEDVAEDLVERAVAAGGCEFVDTVAARLPVALTCELMGVPRGDWPLMYDLTRRAFGSDDPAFQTSPSSRFSAARAHSEIMLYHHALIEERRGATGTDLVSALANGRVDGAPLATDEILLHCDNVLVAGHETVRHASTGGLIALIESPEQWRALTDDRALLNAAVEEILRWTSPAMHVLRTARRDVELGGRRIRAGDAVTVWHPSVNRDERVFVDPDRLDVARHPNRHLALGAGEHYCLGASLARLELRTLFAALLRNVRRAELAGPVVRLRSNVVAGYRSVPVAFSAR